MFIAIKFTKEFFRGIKAWHLYPGHSLIQKFSLTIRYSYKTHSDPVESRLGGYGLFMKTTFKQGSGFLSLLIDQLLPFVTLTSINSDPVTGDCKLYILADNQLVKAACYMNSKRLRFGYRNTWAEQT